jgi:hypothetical protein
MPRGIRPVFDTNPGDYPDPQWDRYMIKADNTFGYRDHENALTACAF